MVSGEERESAAAETRKEKGRERLRGMVALALAAATAAMAVTALVVSRRLDQSRGLLAEAEIAIAERDRAIADRDSALAGWSRSLEEARSENAALREELAFWTDRCVIVTISGEKYHRSGCSALRSGTEVRIFNVEAARSRGYKPCELCGPPEGKPAGPYGEYVILDG